MLSERITFTSQHSVHIWSELAERLSVYIYWLSWYLLWRGSKDGLKPYVFPLAILITKGEKLALAPLYLRSLYASSTSAWPTLSDPWGDTISSPAPTHASCKCSCGSDFFWWLWSQWNTRTSLWNKWSTKTAWEGRECQTPTSLEPRDGLIASRLQASPSSRQSTRVLPLIPSFIPSHQGESPGPNS